MMRSQSYWTAGDGAGAVVGGTWVTGVFQSTQLEEGIDMGTLGGLVSALLPGRAKSPDEGNDWDIRDIRSRSSADIECSPTSEDACDPYLGSAASILVPTLHVCSVSSCPVYSEIHM